MGMDSDHPLAAGEVGKVGVAIDSVDDLEVLFDDIDLAAVRQIRTTANAIGPIWLAMVTVLAERRGINPNDISILIQNDILKEYFARGTYFLPPRPAVELVADTIEYCAINLPNWTPVAISGYHIREAGASAAQEIAFSFSDGLAYCLAAMKRGLPIDAFAPSLFTFLSAGTDILEEVAKFRAARAVWAQSMSKLGAEDPSSKALSIFAFTAGSNLTAQQPMNNVTRVAYSALAAVLGGCQTLHTAAYDEALGTPTSESAQVALRTQQILLHEAGLAGTADPLGGSWAVESLTHDLMAQIGALMAEIDDRGGAIACVESGWFADQVSSAAYEDMLAVEAGERVVVGVNRFRDETPGVSPAVFRIDPESERRQCQRVAQTRADRDSSAVDDALEALRLAATDGANVVPATIQAVRARATVGEICNVLRVVHGAYVPPVSL
jgi:methylmalonyl-CoA mutase N-terminal domain/subunit